MKPQLPWLLQAQDEKDDCSSLPIAQKKGGGTVGLNLGLPTS